jgi:hypothetical protein
LCATKALEGDSTSIFLGFANCTNDSLELKENADDNFDKILLT